MNLFLRALLFNSMFFFMTTADGQIAKEILVQAYEKAKSISSGYYKMTLSSRSTNRKDTVSFKYESYFRVLPDDDIFKFAFYMPYYDSSGVLFRQIFYNGKELVKTNFKDSTAIITSTSEWSDYLKENSDLYIFYDPFTTPSQIPHKFQRNEIHEVVLLENEIIDNVSTHHIKIKYKPANNPKDLIQMLRLEFDYWISMDDFIVRQYSHSFDMLMNKDTVIQYDKMKLDSFSLNGISAQQLSELSTIPSYFKSRDFSFKEKVKLLDIKMEAPKWTLTSVNGKEFCLDSLRGKLVLIDFFYKSCYPCIRAFPSLQSLHEKFSSKGLTVIGIDPFDKDAGDLESFLFKHDITYPVLISEKNFPDKYKVTAYPTLYLIDGNGIILHAQAGFNDSTEKTLEKLIEKNLK